MEKPNKYGYNSTEVVMMVIMTAITNFAITPTIMIFYKQRMTFQLYISCFTLLGSFMYHLLDSLQVEQFFLTELQWHRLDNVGSIVSFMMLLSYLSDLQSLSLELYLDYTGLFIAMIAQEADPWNINYTVVPIAAWIIICFGLKVHQRQLPRLNGQKLRKGLAFMTLAFYCFYYGLDEYWDYLRFYHGMWHLMVSLFSFYVWQTKLNEQDTYTLEDIWSRPKVRYGYYWPFHNELTK